MHFSRFHFIFRRFVSWTHFPEKWIRRTGNTKRRNMQFAVNTIFVLLLTTQPFGYTPNQNEYNISNDTDSCPVFNSSANVGVNIVPGTQAETDVEQVVHTLTEADLVLCTQNIVWANLVFLIGFACYCCGVLIPPFYLFWALFSVCTFYFLKNPPKQQ